MNKSTGYPILDHVSMSNECIEECELIYSNELYRAYFIDPISNLNETCYCLSRLQFDEINNGTYDDYCFDMTNTSDSYGDISVYTKHCPV